MLAGVTVPNEAEAIYFYSQTERFAEFSNFAPFGVKLDALWWPTVEHYFQAQKFADLDYRERIRSCSKPKDAKTLGSSRKLPIRTDWDSVKDEIMLNALRAKFTTHKALHELLLSTGDTRIVEAAPGDAYWGCGADGNGLNRLGSLLMRVREELRGASRT
ncbi:N-glycosidase YbiA [Paracoccaceae bacterium]